MVSLPLFRSRNLPQTSRPPVPGALVKEREAFLHLALVGMTLIGPEEEGLGSVSEELGVSINSLKHIGKHLDEFQELDPTVNLRKLVKIGQDVAKTGTQTGTRTWEKIVDVGGSSVLVRAVKNYAGGLRSVYIVGR